jgi:hypothetical protein
LDCTYDPKEAGECVARIRRLTCENWYEGEASKSCDLVFHTCEAASYGTDGLP